MQSPVTPIPIMLKMNTESRKATLAARALYIDSDTASKKPAFNGGLDILNQAFDALTEKINYLDGFADGSCRVKNFAREFERMERETPRVDSTRTEEQYRSALKSINQAKNRYRDVLPLEESRVVLSGPHRSLDRGTDYVNASFIMDPMNLELPVYIATQGPLDYTVQDFWDMAMQENCTAVISLTRSFEAGRFKCCSYFPLKEGESQSFCHLALLNRSTRNIYSAVVERIIEIQNTQNPGAAPYVIKHYHYEDWPDHGVPEDTKSIRYLMQYLRDSEVRDGPFLIHCSAGIGRTGTYITIDHVLRKVLEGDLTALDIPSRIKFYRSQREGLVQTKEQFRMCYVSVRDELEELLKCSNM